ncbi:hypothetical protein V6B16_05260 [Salinimicrobium catena]|uniref:hypothetical protein n=1 Tax=Salinimicrobium catena TaxID=390640 RepID=UPI002FE4EF64
MKNILKTIFIFFIAFAVIGCDMDDDNLGVDLESLSAPENLGATFQITQDNTGLVTITPTGEGATLFSVDFGDGSPTSDDLKAGESVEHIYAEGNYDVVVTGKNLSGKTAQGIQPLTVSFRAPENLKVTIERDPEDNYSISVSAEADFAAMFQVYFGDAVDEEPTPLMPGETVSHSYETIGTYNIRVVALSGGEATTEFTQEVVISDPLFLPIDFESEKLDYTFINFGPDVVDGVPIIDNPDPNNVNPSSKVAEYTKPVNSEVWAGTTIALDEPIDFSTERYIQVDVWSPTAGTPVLFKVENLADNSLSAEFSTTTTVSEDWETLTFDLNSIDPAVEYGRIVLFFNFGTPGNGETYYFDNIRTTKLELVKLPLTFESENLNYGWNGFGGASGAVVVNPDQSGINTSANVTELNKSSGAQTWAGIILGLDEPVDFSAGTTVKMKVWSPKKGASILFKLEDSSSSPDNNGNPSIVAEVFVNTTTSGEWEELSFDLTTFEAFDPSINYDNLVIFYDFGNPGEGTTFYFDDIKVGDTEYISLFSDIADDVTVDTWRTDWSVSDYEEVSFDGRVTKHYYNLNYVGIETVTNQLDVSSMTHFHTEIWTDNATTFRVKLVDFGPDGAWQGGDDSEHEIVIDNPAQNEWVSLDIPLSAFENLTNFANISQLIYSAAPAGEANVYISNVYFHN